MSQLKLWLMYAENWAEHSVSCTVYYSDDEFLEVGSWVYQNFDKITGISFLPKSDHVYKQAPYESITAEQYEELASKMPMVDWSQLPLYEVEDTTTSSHELACTGGACEVVDLV